MNASLYKRVIQRKLLGNNTLSYEASFEVPIIINSYNRYQSLVQLTAWLQQSGYSNIILLDNNSTYPPLLQFYKTTSCKVIHLGKNAGYKALWETGIFDAYKKNYYVYSDPDVVPHNDCPKDIVYKLYQLLEKYHAAEKCGVALDINDLPNDYDKKSEVLKWEKMHWENQLEKDVYDAPVDTTFALYRPFAFGEAEKCKGIRLAGKYSFKHLPWYVNTQHPSEEDAYYQHSVQNNQSHWIK